MDLQILTTWIIPGVKWAILLATSGFMVYWGKQRVDGYKAAVKGGLCLPAGIVQCERLAETGGSRSQTRIRQYRERRESMAKMKLSPVQSSISRIMGGMKGLTETIDKQLGQKRTQAEISLLTRLRNEWTGYHQQMHSSFHRFLVECDQL